MKLYIKSKLFFPSIYTLCLFGGLLFNQTVNAATTDTLYSTQNTPSDKKESIELSFTKTKYNLIHGDGIDKEAVSLSLKIDGSEVTDEKILNNIHLELNNYGAFKQIKGLTVANITDASRTLSAQKSGVAILSASYGNVKSSNTASVIVPGDVNGDGVISVSDATLFAEKLRGVLNIDSKYLTDLCDMNGSGSLNLSDLQVMFNMIRNIGSYNNSFRPTK